MIGVFGGTFDPVHFGHLRCALEILERLGLDEVRMIPCGAPPHRDQPVATAAWRSQMLAVALADEPRLKLDTRELERAGPSYMVDTLASLRAEVDATPLCLILGGDAFSALPGWSRWQQLIGLAHLIVMRRPGWEPPAGDALGALVASHGITDAGLLRSRPGGYLMFCEVTQLEISASGVRAILAAGLSPRYLLPETVLQLIYREQLYCN